MIWFQTAGQKQTRRRVGALRQGVKQLMADSMLLGLICMPSVGLCAGVYLRPDGTYGSGPESYLRPDGSFGSTRDFMMAPDGSYVDRHSSSDTLTLRPDGTFGTGSYLRPDGSFGNTPQWNMAPDGSYVDSY